MARKSKKNEVTPEQAAAEFAALDEAKFEAAKAAIESKHGKESLMSHDGSYPFECQIRTRSLGLDMVVGPMRLTPNGWQRGVPTGRIIEIMGHESSGKTTLSLVMLADVVHRLGRRVAVLDMEHAIDPSWAKLLGLDMNDDRVLWSQPNTGEECIDMLDILTKSGTMGAILVDSVAALLPSAEADGDINDKHVGLQARLMGQALRKVAPSLKGGQGTLVIFINQMRSSISPGRPAPDTTPGGRALKYAASIRIRCHAGSKIEVGQDKEVVGTNLVFKTMKNKVAPPFREVIVPLRYDRGIDWSLELARLSTSEGIVAQAGSWYTLPDGGKVQGELSLEAAIRQDKSLAVTIADRVMRNVLERRGYGLDGVPLPGTEPFHVVPDDAIPTDDGIAEVEVPV